MEKHVMNVVLPVYNGGHLFISALQSLLQNCPSSVNIFISFNGSSENDYNRFIEFAETVSIKHKIYTYRTHSEISSIHHARIINKWLSGYLSKNDLIMFLCHDDEILSFPSINDIERLKNSQSVFFPKWICVNENQQSRSVEELLFHGSTAVPQNVIFDSFATNNIYTSLSGIIFPRYILSAYCRWSHIKKTGARVELMLASHRSVRHLELIQNHNILVRLRTDSDGQSINLSDCCWDEMVFLVWLLFNLRVIKRVDLYKWISRFHWALLTYKSHLSTGKNNIKPLITG